MNNINNNKNNSPNSDTKKFDSNDFDMDIFDQERSTSIVVAFEELFPLLSISLKTESLFYQELYPYVVSFFETKKQYLDLKEQPLIASSKAFNDIKQNMISTFSSEEKKLIEQQIENSQIIGLDQINPPLSVFELNNENNFIDSTDL